MPKVNQMRVSYVDDVIEYSMVLLVIFQKVLTIPLCLNVSHSR